MSKQSGFTLIELSIVLVIIGLIIGGVLVGQDLIKAAEVRAQITQIEKYNSAVNTFRGKFNALPGDMAVATAQQYAFTVGAGCSGTAGHRDGNGLIDGWLAPGYPFVQTSGETELFWQDLSSNASGGLIEGQFPQAVVTNYGCGQPAVQTATSVAGYLPTAKLGKGDYIYVYEVSGSNWYGLVGIPSLDNNGTLLNATILTNITVRQAYSMDAKADDGSPLTGNIQATFVDNMGNTTVQYSPNTTTSGGNATSCYDTTSGNYSLTVNNGNGGNCALSFRFQ